MFTSPSLSAEELSSRLASAREDYEALTNQHLDLNLTRGKPSPEQLDLAGGLLTAPLTTHTDSDGVDVRNYGGTQGLAELREMFAPLVGVCADDLCVGGNSSLELMHSVIVTCLLHGPAGATTPWPADGTPKMLCPVPGYDRHFALAAHFGIELVPVPLTGSGPDMDVVEPLVAADPLIKGMWCVPQYSNPTGETYSAEVVHRLATMPTASADFRIMWDNAYALHHLHRDAQHVTDMVAECAKAGNPDRVIVFASTSKVTFAGAGVSFVGGSPDTAKWWLRHASLRTIGPDKVNQLRHIRFFGDTAGVTKHMQSHADVLTPKFDAVEQALATHLGDSGLARWTTPAGGYFVSLDVLPGTASEVIALAGKAGIALTPAGATFPLGNDPDDTNIRLAPSFPTLARVETAMAGVATCVRLAGYSKLAE